MVIFAWFYFTASKTNLKKFYMRTITKARTDVITLSTNLIGIQIAATVKIFNDDNIFY